MIILCDVSRSNDSISVWLFFLSTFVRIDVHDFLFFSELIRICLFEFYGFIHVNVYPMFMQVNNKECDNIESVSINHMNVERMWLCFDDDNEKEKNQFPDSLLFMWTIHFWVVVIGNYLKWSYTKPILIHFFLFACIDWTQYFFYRKLYANKTVLWTNGQWSE